MRSKGIAMQRRQPDEVQRRRLIQRQRCDSVPLAQARQVGVRCFRER
jgi:hypothetical protein